MITESFKIDRSLYIAILEDNKKDAIDLRFVLGMLNSRLMAFYFRYTNNEFDNLFPKIRVAEFKKLPIKNVSLKEQLLIGNKVEFLITSTCDFNKHVQSFLKFLQSKMGIEKLNKNLQNWPELDFKPFLNELQKAKIKLTLSEEAECLQYFTGQKQKAQTLKSEIDKTDREIDRMIYELYGLTEEEIGIVEGSAK